MCVGQLYINHLVFDHKAELASKKYLDRVSDTQKRGASGKMQTTFKRDGNIQH